VPAPAARRRRDGEEQSTPDAQGAEPRAGHSPGSAAEPPALARLLRPASALTHVHAAQGKADASKRNTQCTALPALAMALQRPAWVGLDDAPGAGALADMHGDGGSVNDHLRREIAAAGGESSTLRLNGAAAASVDAYLEYRRIVGNADGGVMFSGACGDAARTCKRRRRRRLACALRRCAARWPLRTRAKRPWRACRARCLLQGRLRARAVAAPTLTVFLARALRSRRASRRGVRALPRRRGGGAQRAPAVRDVAQRQRGGLQERRAADCLRVRPPLPRARHGRAHRPTPPQGTRS
jgi:hypothetical protein